jgi:hypothetical protein
MMTEITAFCHNTNHSFSEWERMRWGEYLEMALANVLMQKAREKAIKSND